LDSLSVPIDAQKLLLQAAPATEAPSPDCAVKGNFNHEGERIYPLPGQLAYANINMAAPRQALVLHRAGSWGCGLAAGQTLSPARALVLAKRVVDAE
jgi:hypothetical protein